MFRILHALGPMVGIPLDHPFAALPGRIKEYLSSISLVARAGIMGRVESTVFGHRADPSTIPKVLGQLTHVR